MKKINVLLFVIFFSLTLSSCERKDRDAPVFSNLPSNQTVEFGADLDFFSLGLTADDNFDGDVTSNITVDFSGIDVLSVGSYEVTYTVMDLVGNIARYTITLNIQGSVSPLFADIPQNQEIERGENRDLLDLGLMAFDNVDGDITSNIIVDVTDTTILLKGEHLITYTITDRAGNETTETITLTVLDPHRYFTYTSIKYNTEILIIDYDKDGPKDVVIPSSIAGLPVTKIGEFAFANKQITSVVIPESIEIIGTYAFTYNKLEIISIPESVIHIEPLAFYVNPITNFDIHEDNKYYVSIDGVLFNKGETVLIAFPIADEREAYIIPDTIITIERYAFSNALLSSITIPDGVTMIGEYAFSDNLLTSFIIPTGITTINEGTFKGNLLVNIVLPEGVIEIKKLAFYNNNLTSITFPDGIIAIGEGAFRYNEITSVIIPDNITTIRKTVFANNLITDIFIPDGVTTIEESAFYDNLLTSVIIPDSVLSIGYAAFWKNSLTSLKLSASLLLIEDYAFADNHLQGLFVPMGVIIIGAGAFSNNNLMTINIPDSVRVIEAGAFMGNNLTSLLLPNSVTTIEEWAFADNDIDIILISKNMIIIGESAFYGNPINAVTILGDVTRFNYNWDNIGFPEDLIPVEQ